MNERIIFMVEEPSMTKTLECLMPKLFPHWEQDVHWMVLTHQGKTELEGSISNKLRAWSNKSDRFVIMRDNDGGNCKLLKQRLKQLSDVWPPQNMLIRIVCQELESWFLGDLEAVKEAYGRLPPRARQSSRIFRDPDNLTNAADELRRLISDSRKVARAEKIAPHLKVEPSQNCSKSFQTFLTGLQKLVS